MLINNSTMKNSFCRRLERSALMPCSGAHVRLGNLISYRSWNHRRSHDPCGEPVTWARRYCSSSRSEQWPQPGWPWISLPPTGRAYPWPSPLTPLRELRGARAGWCACIDAQNPLPERGGLEAAARRLQAPITCQRHGRYSSSQLERSLVIPLYQRAGGSVALLLGIRLLARHPAADGE